MPDRFAVALAVVAAALASPAGAATLDPLVVLTGARWECQEYRVPEVGIGRACLEYVRTLPHLILSRDGSALSVKTTAVVFTTDEPAPPVTEVRAGKLDLETRRALGDLLAAARVGFAGDCDPDPPPGRFLEESELKLAWFGRGIRQNLVRLQGVSPEEVGQVPPIPACSAEMVLLVEYLLALHEELPSQ